MHNFLDVLLKHFIRVGDTLGNDDNTQEQLDFLSKTIFKVCQDVPDACGPLWGRTLKIFQSQLQKRLRDFVLGIVLYYTLAYHYNHHHHHHHYHHYHYLNDRRTKLMLAKSWTITITALVRSCFCCY